MFESHSTISNFSSLAIAFLVSVLLFAYLISNKESLFTVS